MTDKKKDQKPVTLGVAIRKHIMPNDTLKQVQKEISELSNKDRRDLREWFEAEGIKIMGRGSK